MGSKIPVSFFELCRLCLEMAGEVNIFNTEDLVDDIFTCTSVKVSVKENLPPKICLKCQEIVYSAKNLRVLALKNNLHLHTLFGEEDDDITNKSDETIENTLSESNISKNEYKRRFFFEDEDINILENKIQKKAEKHHSNEHNEKSSEIKVPMAISVRKDIFESTPPTVTPLANPKEEAVSPETKKIKKSPDVTEIECSVCKKTFETKKKYSIHKRTHYKNLYCPLDTCGKKFATKGDVERHIRTHTGEKPYQCEVCDKSFAQRGTLKAHREARHGGGAFIIGK